MFYTTYRSFVEIHGSIHCYLKKRQQFSFLPLESTKVPFCMLPASERKQVKMEASAINEHGSVSSSAKVALVKATHSQKEEQPVRCTNELHVSMEDAANTPTAEATNSYLPADELFEEDMWDPEYYEEQDSFS
jgi:hypothetical protein